MEAISGVYKITSVLSGKFYIGSSQNVQARWRKHKSELNLCRHHSRHMQHAWSKYGEENFIFEILETTVKEENISREQYYLDTLKPQYNGSPTAYSVLGIKRTEEQKKRYSESKKYGRAPWAGKKMSAEHREKIGASRRGIKVRYIPHPSQNKAVLQMTMQGEFIAKHASITFAAKSVNRVVSGLSVHLSGKTKHCGGFTWKFNNE